MKYTAILLFIFFSVSLTNSGAIIQNANYKLASEDVETIASARNGSKDDEIRELVKSMEHLYRVVYRPPLKEPKKVVLSVQYQQGNLFITYGANGKKQVVKFDIQQVQPHYRFVKTGKGEDRSFVYDTKTGTDIFCWLEKRADAAMLRQDIKNLQALVQQ